MPIKIDKNNFYLETDNTMYQIQVDEYSILRHIWYGAKTQFDMSYLSDYPDVGFSGNLYDAGNTRTHSPDTLLQEYPAAGNGDFRICAISALLPDGSRTLDLRYQSHRVTDGKYSIPDLPAVYCEKDAAQTLEISLRDAPSGIEVVLKYGVLPHLDVITRSASVKNCGSAPITIQKVHSLCLDIPQGEWQWIHFHGKHTMERQAERRALLHGIQESSSSRGTSSHQQNPSVIFCRPDCGETHGDCIGALLMYSGGFQTRIERDQLSQTRLIMGLDENTFEWSLSSGDTFHTPEAILSFSSDGFERLSHNFHRLIKNNVCRGKYKNSPHPLLINNWEATYFDFSGEKLLNIARSAAEMGLDMFVLDDGWFAKRDSDLSSLGDWYVNEEKLGSDLHSFVEKIKTEGLNFGIWCEPEMVSEDSALYCSHPDWAIKIPDRSPIRSRFQLVLDLSRPDVCEYIYTSLSLLLKSADISYLKWDMNRSITNWYSALLPAEKQGEAPHRYVLGLYSILERLNTDFPNVLIEGCSGGGGRFDAGMLYYCPQIWCSDNTDAYDRSLIQYGTSFFYPISAVGSHVSAVPNHQSGRVTPLAARSIAAMAGSYGCELDLEKLTACEKDELKAHIQAFKKYRFLIHSGYYYRLNDPAHDNYALSAFSSEDKSELLVLGLIFRAESNSLRPIIRLRGLDPDKYYLLEQTGQILSGKTLLDAGILLPRAHGDYYPIEFHFTEALQ